jgi:hypothetical protein
MKRRPQGARYPACRYGFGGRMPSTAIERIHYREGDHALFVRFRNGGEYVYADVPREVHRAFVQAPSKGRFFQAKIRDRYRFDRLDS